MDTKQKFIEIYKKLPKKIRFVINSHDFNLTCEDILKKNNIPENNWRKLEDLVIYKIVDIVKKEEFEDDIKKILESNKYNTQSILNDVYEKIINNIDGLYIKSLETIKIEEESKGNEFNINDYLLEDISEKKPSQKIIGSDEIKKRISEISIKYNLNQSQKEALEKIVSYPEINQNYKEKIVGIGISSILAEQIVEDLEKRVFEYALREVGETKPKEKQREGVAMETKSNIPEIRPSNLPKVEENKNVDRKFDISPNTKIETPKIEVEKEVPIVISKIEPEIKPLEIKNERNNSTYKPQNDLEMVQKPIGVPRFTAPKDDGEDMGTVTVDTPKIEVEKEVVDIKPEVKIEKPKEDLTKKYVSDPYREPIN